MILIMQNGIWKKLNAIFLSCILEVSREFSCPADRKLCSLAFQCVLCAGVVFGPYPRVHLGSCTEKPVAFLKLCLTSIFSPDTEAGAVQVQHVTATACQHSIKQIILYDLGSSVTQAIQQGHILDPSFSSGDKII